MHAGREQGASVQGRHFLNAELLGASRVGVAEGFHKNVFGLGWVCDAWVLHGVRREVVHGGREQGAPVQGGHFLKAELLRAGRIGLAEGFHKNAFG